MKFWHIAQPKAQADPAAPPAPAEMLLYGVIGETEYWDDVVDRLFVADLAAIESDTIRVRINSIGGSLFAGIAIHNALRAHPAQIAVEIDGLAASAASIVAMAGDTITMRRGSMMMIHAPYALARGTAEDLEDAADMLRKATDQIAAIYAARTGAEKEDEIRAMLARDSWMTADEAIALGLADAKDEDAPPVAASLHARGCLAVVNGLGFPDPPASLCAALTPEPEPEPDPDPEEPPDPADDPAADPPAEPISAADLRDAYPSVVAEIRAEAARTERKRILGLEAVCLAGHEPLVIAAKADGTTQPADLALAIIRAETARRKEVGAQLVKDGAALRIPSAPPPSADQTAAAALARTRIGVETINARRGGHRS